MKIDTAGTYTLRYSATDDCGNTTTKERELDIVTLRTAQYTDGTLIINEKSSDIEANIQRHGSLVRSFAPLSDANPYIFTEKSQRPWSAWTSAISRVEIGNTIKPISTAYWFSQMANVGSMDLSLMDTVQTTSMKEMFNGTGGLRTLDISHFDTSNVTDMSFMFLTCGVEHLDLSNFNTSNATNMQRMFGVMQKLKTLNVSGFDTSNVENMEGMFISAGRDTFEGALDVSSFDTSKVTNMASMFRNFTRIKTIYASGSFVTTNVTNSANMFDDSSALVGGAGTTYTSSNPTDKTYARIDNPPDAPGYFTVKPSA